MCRWLLFFLLFLECGRGGYAPRRCARTSSCAVCVRTPKAGGAGNKQNREHAMNGRTFGSPFFGSTRARSRVIVSHDARLAVTRRRKAVASAFGSPFFCAQRRGDKTEAHAAEASRPRVSSSAERAPSSHQWPRLPARRAESSTPRPASAPVHRVFGRPMFGAWDAGPCKATCFLFWSYDEGGWGCAFRAALSFDAALRDRRGFVSTWFVPCGRWRV